MSLASSGYLELGMFNEAAQVLEDFEPEEKTRNEVLGARLNLYMAVKKWDMVAVVASHLVKVDPPKFDYKTVLIPGHSRFCNRSA